MAYEQNHIAQADKHQPIVTEAIHGFRLLIGLLVLGCLMSVLSGCATSYTGTHRFSNESLQHPERIRRQALRSDQTTGDVRPDDNDSRRGTSKHDSVKRSTSQPEVLPADQYHPTAPKERVLSAEWVTRKAGEYLGEDGGELVGICTSMPLVKLLLYIASRLLEPLLSN